MKQDEGVFDVDDARLSAYVFGELDEAERADVEVFLARDANARAFVDELRVTAGELERELANEPALALSAEQRAAIDGRSKQSTRSPRWVWFSVAAGILAFCGLTYLAGYGGWFGVHETAHSAPHSVANASDPNVVGGLQGEVAGLDTPAVPGDAGDIESIDRAEVFAEDEVGVGQAHGGSALAFGARRGAGAARPQFRAFRAPSEQSVESIERRMVPAPASMPELVLFEDTVAGETYAPIHENPFQLASSEPLSTFSIDVDTASYSNVRRMLNAGTLPPADAVRVEELLNYFRYAYPPAGDAPFSVSANVASCPWAPSHQLVQIGLRGADIDLAKRPASNLVFLVDVSGSMDEPDKLPLLVQSLELLVRELDGRDHIALVVYAGNSGLVLPSTSCDHQTVIANALHALQAGGSTNGGEGIELAYRVAAENFTKEGQNRVVLCTDGDFNVGVTDRAALEKLVEEKRASGVFLSVLGFGTGNTQDATMELLADKGNGNYAYIDTLAEARKVLVHELGGTLVTIAKDVKIQVEFNPARVQAWRLVGYENRVLAHQDFNDDKKDAGEIGAGHTVTALYEIVPPGVELAAPGVDALRYQTTTQPTNEAFGDELMNLKLRYKQPDGDTSQLITTPVRAADTSWQTASADFKFAAAVAGFGLVLRKSSNAGTFTLQDVLNLATQGVGADAGGYRGEFVELVRKAQALTHGEKR